MALAKLHMEPSRSNCLFLNGYWRTSKSLKMTPKTDASIAWMATIVLHLRWKWQYFDNNWQQYSSQVRTAKTQLKRLWDIKYKTDINPDRLSSPEPATRPSFIEEILDKVAPPSSSNVARPTTRRDQLALYLEEAPISHIGVMDYWRQRESVWPELAHMAYDFLAIPAMSSECERVFSSCAKQTTPESSRLTGKLLWH